MMNLLGKRVVVLGFARSGYSVAKLLAKSGARVLVSERKSPEQLKKSVVELQNMGVEFEFGGHSRQIFDADFVVVSPGVSLRDGILNELANSSIPIYSEIEIASWFNRGKIIGITGSNGKSTTSTLTHRIIVDAKRKGYLAGNIGIPFSEIAAQTKEDDIVVLELSSFQLERIASFAPYVSVILNLSPDHLDRYDSVETYYFAKLRIWENQDERDLACIRMDDPILTGYIERCKAKILGFARRYFGIHGVYAYDGWINIVGDDGKEERLIEIQSLGLIGPHNEWNVAASVAATLPLDIERDSICNTLMNFKGIEHRLEFVRELEGVLFYNDSKSTNPDSLDWALQTFTGSIILIAGGLDKGTDFSFLRNRISEKVKLAILIGKAKEKLRNEWIGATEIIIANSLPDAVELAFENSSPGDIVLLSPGCASFDMFDNFEHRGRVFKELVNKLKSKYEKRT